MKRVRQGLAALAVAFAAGCAPQPTEETLTACILNDSTAPVSIDIEAVAGEVLTQYERHVGVHLEITHSVDWPFVVPQVPHARLEAVGRYLKENEGSYAPLILERDETLPQDATTVDFNEVGEAIAQACNADVRVLFTNKKLYFAYLKDDQLRARVISGNYLRSSSSVFIYNADAWATQTDACGNSLIETVLKHELGHKWYGDGHDNDLRSFMHGPAIESCGAWTRAVARRIRDGVSDDR